MFRGLCMLLFLWLFVLCSSVSSLAADNDVVAVDIGVIYDENGGLGKMGLSCIQMALSDFYNSHVRYKTRIVLHTRLYHPKDSIVGAASSALYLLKYAEVKAIIGPTTSVDAEFVINLGERAQVPVISYTGTSPVTSSRSSYSIRVAEEDYAQVKAITALIQQYQWKDVVLIYVDSNVFGAGIIPYLDDALQKINARILSHEALSLTATDDQILQLLQKLKAMQTRVFVVHSSPDLASRLFIRADELNMMGQGYVWITTTSISNELGSLDDSVIQSMQGVLGVQTYFPETNELKRFKSRWRREFEDMKLNVIGLWAYDAACALARAVEEVAAPNSGFRKAKMTGNLTDLDSLGVSPVGPDLLKALSNTTFIGLAGNFSLSDGRLSSSSTYKIINIFGRESRDVGFWTPEKGLLRNLKATTPASNTGLRPVIWPGDITPPPKGWEIPASGKKLRVGVPVRVVYQQLVNVTRVNSSSNTGSPQSSIVTGFCIDIFDAVMKKLGYSHQYDYIPFKTDSTSDDSYDNLVYQVFLQNFDVVVGDITIIANRTLYVDFTLPFSESGVTLVAPARIDTQSAWVFLKPLTWDLWVTTLSAFVFIAFVIWVLEHRINEEFRGPPLHQAGTSLFFSFSMMVFAQRENVLSNLTRIVVVVWVFVVLVLTQSYTASLTSMLTVQQLQPTVTGVDELLNTGAYVGFQAGSFIKELLRQKGFHESKIISYNTSENLDDLLSKGSGKGGIAAVFDELPYMKLFTSQYPSKYVMMQPIYKTDGFGFAFPKGSALVSEVSGQILRVTEGDKMSTLEREWGMQPYNSSDQGNKVTSASLSIDSFWGLFLIVAVASGFSLVIYLVDFLYDHRGIWMYSDAPIWSRTQTLARAFDNRDMAAHTFRKRDVQSTLTVETDQASIDGDKEDEITPTANTPPRPSEYSDMTEENVPLSRSMSPSHQQVME